MEDYETIDYKQHYEATKECEQRIKQLEKKIRQLENAIGFK